jgi:hypothetical protein
MNMHGDLQRCLGFIDTQLRGSTGNRIAAGVQRPVVTFSRQAGCGALAVAEHLATILQAQTPEDEPRWTIFDRNLIKEVLQEHHLPERLAKYMPENRISEVSDTLDELFGLHPPSWLLVRQIAETILHLAKLGNVILIGRGANVVTAKLDYAFHVRLVASLEKRVQRIHETDKLNRKAAMAFIRREDRGRGFYLKKYYDVEIDDPLLYHLFINTDLIGYERAARLIADCMSDKAASKERLKVAA